MSRFWIFFEVGPVSGIRTVDISHGDLLAGFDPIDTMWHELAAQIGRALDGLDRFAKIERSTVLEDEKEWGG